MCIFTDNSLQISADLKLELKRGQPVVSIPLPTSGEVCEFTLQNTHSVRSFVDSIREEDGGVEHAAIHSLDGNRVAQTTRLSTLLTEGFNLKINDQSFTIQPTSEGTHTLVKYGLTVCTACALHYR